jgi:threonine dehydrogenase-like Zn-dependent dehydrogenase
MTDMVRAAVQVAPRQIELREFPRPSIGADDGLLRVEANGICGSDVESYRGHLGMGRGPTIPGHEPMGIIEEIGDRAAERWGVQPGDRVALEVIVPCRSCHDCLTGRYQSCRNRKFGHGVTGIDVAPSLWGGFAEHLYLTPGAVLHKVDKTLPAELAVMFNPLGAGVRWAVHLGEVGLGDTLLVLGAGQRGLASVIAARAAGAGRSSSPAWRPTRTSWRWPRSSGPTTRSSSTARTPRTPSSGSGRSPAGTWPTSCSS